MRLLCMIIARPTVHVYLIATRSRTWSAKAARIVECHVVSVSITLHQYHMRDGMSSASGRGNGGVLPKTTLLHGLVLLRAVFDRAIVPSSYPLSSRIFALGIGGSPALRSSAPGAPSEALLVED